MEDSAIRFFCDEMLAQLARYLRAAGYDTALARDGVADSILLGIAARESRWFLTLDRELFARRTNAYVILLDSGTLDDHAALLARHFSIDWVSGSFTRCLVDNTPLRAASQTEARILVPHYAHQREQRYLTCPACRRIYWRGSHYRRMHERLTEWQRLYFTAAPADNVRVTAQDNC